MIHSSFEHGLLLLGCGRNTVRITPPLSVTQGEIDEGLAIFEHSLTLAEADWQAGKLGTGAH